VLACAFVVAASGCKERRLQPAVVKVPGPSLDSVGPAKGVLSLRFPKRLPGARVEVWEETRSGLPDGFHTEPGEFPVRMAVPINAILIKATAPDYSPFEKRVVFTSQEREREVIIALPDEPHPDRFGVRMADLPDETGFLPLAVPEAGRPAALIFEHLTGRYDWASGDWSSELLVVDENADVWRGRCSREAPEPVYVRIGRIEARAFASVRALRSRSVQASPLARILPLVLMRIGPPLDHDSDERWWGSRWELWEARSAFQGRGASA
nr:hypothetical protein [Gemmatimonadales bacterium]